MNIRRKSTITVRPLPLIIGIFTGSFLYISFLMPDNHISSVIIPKIVEQIHSKAKPWLFPEPKTVKDITKCKDKVLNMSVELRGDYYVLYNYVIAEKSFKCDESVTYSAPADFTFLDNIPNIVERWNGPVSVALYTPGEDFFSTLDSIAYLRACESVFVREYVTFHLFFDKDHVPIWESSLLDYTYEDQFDCHGGPPWTNINSTYRTMKNLLYPINLARNVAKITAQTHFVFPSDIELYPSDDLITNFMDFVLSRPQLFSEDARNVFVLPPFEVNITYDPPRYKNELQTLYYMDAAIPFHAEICASCHRIPKLDEWINHVDNGYLDVFSETKRQGSYLYWEPFFICTQKEPLWDERLSWEGQGDKMQQAYSLCLLDYNFLILNNAFVVHKPGIKTYKKPTIEMQHHRTENNKILENIPDELQPIYGFKNECNVMRIPRTELPIKFTTDSSTTSTEDPSSIITDEYS